MAVQCVTGNNAMGNITSKTSLGSYAYPLSGTSSIRPHALSGVGASSYSYDNDADDQGNGNMTSRAGDAITWYSYDKPNTINKSGGNSSQFFYGADRSRFKQVATIGSGGPLTAGTETTLYVAGGMFEKVTKSPSGVVEYKHYIMGGSGGAVAIRTLRAGTSSVNDTRYLHKDHLGSLTVITDESAGVVARLSYDAFGNRRDGISWSGTPSSGEWSAIQAVTHRGFTFHEHLDNVEAIHMNGRVFDPKLGRFLSADPFVQAPGFSQSFNRYSYTFNNPLSFIDPSGYAGTSPDQPDAPEIRPYLPMFPDRGITNADNGEGRRNGLVRAFCNAHPGFCVKWVQPYKRVESYSGRTVGGATLGNQGGWRYVDEPRRIRQEQLMVGYIGRRETMGIFDFARYTPGGGSIPRVDRLPSGRNIDQLLKDAARDIRRAIGQEAGNVLARAVQVDELYDVRMSYDVYAGDMAYYEPGHEPLCCRSSEFRRPTPGAVPSLRLIDWRYQVLPGPPYQFGLGDGWHRPGDLLSIWDVYQPVSPVTP